MKTRKLSTITAALLISGLMISGASAANLTASSGSPHINFDDTDVAGIEWNVWGTNTLWGVYDDVNNNYGLLLYPDTHDVTALTRNSDGGVQISGSAFNIHHSVNKSNSLNVDTSGDINLANGSVFIDRSVKRMGVGTTTPSKTLDVIGDIEIGTSSSRITLQGYSNALGIHQDGISQQFLLFDDAPSRAMEIDAAGTTIKGRLKSAFSGSSPTNADPVLNGLLNLVELSSNNTNAAKTSDVGFALRNARENFQWNFRTIETGEGFAATKEGTGGAELRISNPTGGVAGTQLFLGNGAKNTTGVWQNASSRALKENIQELSSEDAMRAFYKLKPMTYNYKTNKKESYVGFIAEDVPELVAINGRDSLSSMDMVAVLTKVVQEQDNKMKVMQEEIVELKAMKKKVAQLESLLTNLALQTTSSRQDKFSFNVK